MSTARIPLLFDRTPSRAARLTDGGLALLDYWARDWAEAPKQEQKHGTTHQSPTSGLPGRCVRVWPCVVVFAGALPLLVQGRGQWAGGVRCGRIGQDRNHAAADNGVHPRSRVPTPTRHVCTGMQQQLALELRPLG